MKKNKINPMMIGAVVLGLASVGLILYIFTGMQADADARLKAEIDRIRAEMAAQKPGEVTVIEKKETLPVVFASQNIAANTKIDGILLEIKEVDKELFPDAFSTIEEVADKYASRNILPNEVLSPGNVSADRITMSERLTPGKRAFALPVIAEQDSSGGFIVDGDYVDLILSYTQGTNIKVVTAMQNVKVLFIPGGGPRTDSTTGLVPSPPAGSNVAVTTTFEVTPEQAEELIALSQMGTLRMVLRHRDDDIEVRTAGTDTRAIAANPAASNQRSKRSERKAQEKLQEIKAKTELEVQNEDRDATPSVQP